MLAELFECSGCQPARVQVWIDQGLCKWDESLTGRITKCLSSVSNAVELVAPIEALPGGEAVKNDPTVVHHLLESFHRDNLDRRSYVLVIGGGAILDTVGYAASIAHRHSTNSRSDNHVSPSRLWSGSKECGQLV